MAHELPSGSANRRREEQNESSEMDDSNKYNVNKLNPGQKAVYEQLIAQLTTDVDPKTGSITKSKVITLDAPPGTGKSYIISTLANDMNFKPSIQAIAYSNNLVNNLKQNNVECQTNFRFLDNIYTFRRNDFDTNEAFGSCKITFGDGKTLEDSLFKVYENIMAMRISTDILILDEYTVPSPWVLLCLALAGRRLKKHIIFTGDGDQLSCIDRSNYHKQTNRSLAVAISDQYYTLDEQMRITDPAYNEMLIQIKKKFHPFQETDLSFDIIFTIYTYMKQTFFSDELSAMFLSGYKNNIKNRENLISKHKMILPPLCTYHKIIGSTISRDKIVLDMYDQQGVAEPHRIKANSIYVGLSRLCSSDQLAGIRYPMNYSLIYTQLMNDAYYYYIKSFSQEWEKDIELCYVNGIPELPTHLKIRPMYMVRDVNAFTNMPLNCCILRSAFKRRTYAYKPKKTGMVQIAEFLRRHDFLLENISTREEISHYFNQYINNNTDNEEPETEHHRME